MGILNIFRGRCFELKSLDFFNIFAGVLASYCAFVQFRQNDVGMAVLFVVLAVLNFLVAFIHME